MPIVKKLYLENLRVGDELSDMIKPPIDRLQIARYAGAANDFHPLCVDEVAAREMQMPSICVPSLLPMGFMGQFVQDWLKGGKLVRFAIRFNKMVWPGDSITCKGRVLARRRDQQGRYLVDIDLWAVNQKGETVLKGQATGMLYFNAEDEARQRRGEQPLEVEVSERSELPRNPKPKSAKHAFAEDELEDDMAPNTEPDDSDESENEQVLSSRKSARPAVGKAPSIKPALKASKAKMAKG